MSNKILFFYYPVAVSVILIILTKVIKKKYFVEEEVEHTPVKKYIYKGQGKLIPVVFKLCNWGAYLLLMEAFIYMMFFSWAKG